MRKEEEEERSWGKRNRGEERREDGGGGGGGIHFLYWPEKRLFLTPNFFRNSDLPWRRRSQNPVRSKQRSKNGKRNYNKRKRSSGKPNNSIKRRERS
jgi:hypothetical protein